VLFDPPFKGSTYVLWLGPFAILMLAAIGVAIFFRRRAQEPARTRELSADEPAGMILFWIIAARAERGLERSGVALLPRPRQGAEPGCRKRIGR
jgi:cytochrome c-type biogenesis protein CcmH/NrfF